LVEPKIRSPLLGLLKAAGRPGLLPSGSGKRVAALNLKLKELAEGVAVEGGGVDQQKKSHRIHVCYIYIW